MQITIEFPETLLAKTAEMGLSPSEYTQRLLDSELPAAAPRERLSIEEFLRVFPIDGLPNLPDSALTRESMYPDR